MATITTIQRFLDADDEPLTTETHIEISEQEAVVSLKEATNRLKNSIDNLDKLVQTVQKIPYNRLFDLTNDEAAAIHLYTIQLKKSKTNVSKQLNQAFRSGNIDELEPWLLYIKLFVSALRKIPTLKGTIFRGVQGNISDKYNDKCIWWGFSSCTKSKKALKYFLSQSSERTIFQIECTNGILISDCSQFQEEDEVLLLPGTYLRVKDKENLGEGLYVVYLEEVNDKNLLLASLVGTPSSMVEACPKEQASHSNAMRSANPRLSMQLHKKSWLDLRFHSDDEQLIMTPEDLQTLIEDPPINPNDPTLNRVQGSMAGMALGDALGAHVEFRPRQYLKQHPVLDLQGGGTWGLKKGQFTDDTSMALCLASSLVTHCDFIPYDQLVRYKWWYKHGYMSSTGHCFDIGDATRRSLIEFERRQRRFANEHQIRPEKLDHMPDPHVFDKFNVFCSEEGVAGNGALMRLAPVPLFFYKYPIQAVEFSGVSGLITHGDQKAYDACRYYGALIVAALQNATKNELLDDQFYSKHESWFNKKSLTPEIMKIAKGSYKKHGGYDAGIRGKGYIVNALEAALWALWSNNDSFEAGALNAVNLGDDTDTTAAIYGQLAGALYGFDNLPKKWVQHLYAPCFIECLSKWITYEGKLWRPPSSDSDTQLIAFQPNPCTVNTQLSEKASVSELTPKSESVSASSSEQAITRKSSPRITAQSSQKGILRKSTSRASSTTRLDKTAKLEKADSMTTSPSASGQTTGSGTRRTDDSQKKSKQTSVNSDQVFTNKPPTNSK